MKSVITAIVWCMIAGYPLLVFYGLQSVQLDHLGAAFIGLALIRIWFSRSSANGQLAPLVLSGILILVAAYTILTNSTGGLRFYPVAVNFTLLAIFGASLFRGMPVVERLARLQESNLPPAAVLYTRSVTKIWCIFFIFNGLAALYTAIFSSFEMWAWYNGAVAYCLMGAIFSVEWLVRQSVQRRVDA